MANFSRPSTRSQARPAPPAPRSRCRRPASAGFTLVEVTIALALLGLAVVAVTQAVTAGQMQTHAALHRARATMLAEAMLEEVLSKPYGDPQPPLGSGGSRGDFTEISDYHGFEESPGTLRDQVGELYPAAYQNFTRMVNVAEDTQTVPSFGDADGLLVTVTVADERQGVWMVVRFVPEPSP